MKHIISVAMLLWFVSLTGATRTFAQPRFEVPITVTDGVTTQILYFGILTGGHYCIDPADCMNGHCEYQLPPVPPGGIFDTRFVFPRPGPITECFDQGSYCDFRPYTSFAERDTFRVKSQFGSGTSMSLSWPAGLASRSLQLSLRYFDQVQGANVNINMLTDTMVNVTDAGDPATVTIFSGGMIEAVEPISPDIPREMKLFQNNPNPFNPETSIKFQIPSSSFVSLKVYDVLGREVATVANERLTAGTYEKTFAAEGLTSGVYFYRLQADGVVQTKKLLLLR